MHYDGQVVMRHVGWDEKFPNDYVSYNCIMDKGFYLELTPLSQITDEDAIEVGKLYEYAGETRKTQNDCFKEVGKDYIEDTGADALALRILDYLRSKGYALPWLDTTVEEQIEYGWVKLKPSTTPELLNN